MNNSYQQMLKEQFLNGKIAIIASLPHQKIDVLNFAKRCGLDTNNIAMNRCYYVSSEKLLSTDSIIFAKQQTKDVVWSEDCDFLYFSFNNQTPLCEKDCIVDYANKLTDYIISTRNENPNFDISDILAYITSSKYEYQPPEYIFTGHFDANRVPIYVGDTVKEGCNGLVRKVVIDYSKGGYWLEGLGEGYGIENASTEWEVQEPSIHSQIRNKCGKVEMEEDFEKE